MPSPAAGLVRVFPRHSVGPSRAHRWQDLPEDDHRLAGWIDAGLVALTGPHGEAAPEDIPATRCCGGVRR